MKNCKYESCEKYNTFVANELSTLWQHVRNYTEYEQSIAWKYANIQWANYSTGKIFEGLSQRINCFLNELLKFGP